MYCFFLRKQHPEYNVCRSLFHNLPSVLIRQMPQVIKYIQKYFLILTMKFSCYLYIYRYHLTNSSHFFPFSSFDRLLLSTSVESNECNIQKIFFFFHYLLCHLTREAVGPSTIERKREGRKRKKKNNNKHIHVDQ